MEGGGLTFCSWLAPDSEVLCVDFHLSKYSGGGRAYLGHPLFKDEGDWDAKETGPGI